MIRALTLALTLLAVSACSRGLTPNEAEVAKSLFGPSLDTAPIRVMTGIGVTPLPRPRPAPTLADGTPVPPRKPPEGLCERKQRGTRVIDWPAAFVIENKIFFRHELYAPDAFAGLPGTVPFPASLLMGHELVHVWQWQNRARTGYTTQGAGGESFEKIDPYYFETHRDAEFLSYGYEQQGAIMQDFLCYALFDADDPKLGELTALLRPVLPVDGFLKKIGR